MNRAERRAAQFKRAQRWDRNKDLAHHDAILNRLALARTYDVEDFSRISVEARMCWHRLSTGEGTENDFDDLAHFMNACSVAARGIDELLYETMLRGQLSMVRMQKRYERIQRFGPDAQALADIPMALDVMDEITRNSTPLQMVSATRESMRMIRAGKVLTQDTLRG